MSRLNTIDVESKERGRYEVEKEFNPYAVASLFFGILGIMFLPIWVIGLCAVYAGDKFRRIDKQSKGNLRGKYFAIIGTTLGIVPFFVFIFQLIVSKGIFSMLGRMDCLMWILLAIFLTPVILLFLWLHNKKYKKD
jgi:hypothetical protein